MGYDETDLVPIAIGNPMMVCLALFGYRFFPMVRCSVAGYFAGHVRFTFSVPVRLLVFRANNEPEYRYKKGAQQYQSRIQNEYTRLTERYALH